jgi:hypothetical protein
LITSGPVMSGFTAARIIVASALGMRAKHEKIHRVAVVQRHADLTVGLEASDAGAVSRTRIDDQIRPLPVAIDEARRIFGRITSYTL